MVIAAFVPLNDRAEPYLPPVVQVALAIVPVPSSKPYAATSPGGGPCTALLTVTVTDDDVWKLPVGSRATAVNVCVPFASGVVSHVTLNGALRDSVPITWPSTSKVTPATRSLSDAFAVTLTVLPDTVAFCAGAVRDTVGLAVSAVP